MLKKYTLSLENNFMLLIKPFIIDESTLIYKELLERVCNDNYYFKCQRFCTINEFIVNFVKSVFYCKDIVLIDNNCSDNELNNLGINVNNTTDSIKPYKNLTLENLIIDLKKSSSKITIFTSGTTGIPKKVIHTIPSLSRMVRCGEKYNDNIWGFAYNPTHMAGLQVLLQAILNQNTIVNLFERSYNEITNLIDSHQVTHISSTPTFYRLLASSPQVFNHVKRITLGGEKYDAQLEKKLAIKFPNAKINNIYASTEVGSLLVTKGSYFKIPENLMDKVKIIDNQLMVHKTLLAINDEIKTEWYATGDLIEFASDDSSIFKFIRRESDLINIGGYKVNPNEVEEVILRLENIIGARVYSKENSVMGKILYADIVTDYPIDIKELRIELSHYLQDFKIPRIIKRVKQIEVTRTGKVKRTS